MTCRTLLLFPLAGGLAAAAATPPHVLPPVDVVTAPIVSETAVNAFGFQTTSVGPEQLTALNAQDLASALRRTPGVTITRYNPVGAFGGGEGGAVFLRGLGSSRPGGEIKATLEGVPTGNAVFNHPLLDVLPVDLAGGIEVMRRAEPLAAGNMFGGVNVLVPRAHAEGAFVRGTITAGSFGAFGERLAAGGSFGPATVYAGQSYRRADGHRPDAAGRLAHALARVGWQVAPALELSYLVHRTDNRATDPGPEAGSGLPGTRGDLYATEGWVHLATAAWTRAHGGGSLKGYVNRGEGNWLRRATSANADSLNEYRLSGVRWRETQRAWSGGEIVGGVDADWARGRTISVPPGAAPPIVFGPQQFRLFSAFAGARHTWRGPAGWELTPSAGARYYTHEEFGRAWAPQAGMVAQRGPLRLHASFGRAVSFPSLEVAAFSAVAIPALGQTWRSLRPERLDSTELGARYEISDTLAVDATLFRNEGRERYVFVPPPPPPFRFVNLERFRTRGGEFTVTARPVRTLSLFAGASHVDAAPDDLPYAPRWSLVGGAAWQIVRGLVLNVDTSYVSAQRVASQARAAGGLNAERVAAFALVNARLGYEFPLAGARAEIFVAGENLLDREYRYRVGYPMPGAGFTAGLSAGF